MTKRVIIIGGGYAGTQLARALDADAEVMLVEPREAFVHNVGAIRAVVDPALTERLIFPYDRLLKRGRVIRERAVAVSGTTVELASGRELAGEIVVLATGSTYAAPFKPQGEMMADFHAAVSGLHRQLASAARVAIIGAGAVGVELAGEIASAMPGKRIDLRSADRDLFPAFNPGLGQALARQLGRLVDAGIFLRIAACHDARRVEYRLTPLGEALRPMLQALDLWGEDWQRSRPPVVSEPAARTATPRQPA